MTQGHLAQKFVFVLCLAPGSSPFLDTKASLDPKFSDERFKLYFSLAIIAFGAFPFIVPKDYCRSGKMEIKESRHLIQGGYALQGSCSKNVVLIFEVLLFP